MHSSSFPEHILRKEWPAERCNLPVPTELEKDQAYQLLPNTPLGKDAALEYGALMFALGRRQISMEVRAWLEGKHSV